MAPCRSNEPCKNRANRLSLARMLNYYIRDGSNKKKAPVADLCDLCAVSKKIFCSRRRLFGKFADTGNIGVYVLERQASDGKKKKEIVTELSLHQLPTVYEE